MVLSAGVDKAVKVTTEKVVPSNKGIAEDQSTWFVQDKKYYRIRTEERLINVHNTRSTDTLVLVVENLPKSTEDIFKVELMSPVIIHLPAETETLTDKEYMLAVLKYKFSSDKKTADANQKVAHMCQSSNNIYWAVWLKAGERQALSFKYKVTSPDVLFGVLAWGGVFAVIYLLRCKPLTAFKRIVFQV
ncbi:DUF4139 domain-containing protein [archaeon]|nr:MAG: DUF4139 domain-containing protein [archaeon]